MDVLIDGEIVLYGAVGDYFWGDFFTAKDVVTALAQIGRSSDVNVRINSAGGIVDEGIAIFNALRAHSGQVTVYVDSMAASSASVIAMAGDEIVMRRGSMMMIHDPSQITVGDAADHEKSLESLNVYANSCAEIYSEQSGLTPDECRADMREELWLTAEDAVERGYADRIDGVSVEPVMFNYRLFTHAPEPMVALADKREWPSASRKRAAKSAAKTRQKESPMANNEPADKNAVTTALQEADQKHAADVTRLQTENAAAVSAAATSAATATKDRVKAILTSDEAKGREAQANTLAFETELTIEQAVAVLKTGAKAVPVSENRFAAAMDTNGNPKVGDGGGNGEDTEETVAKRIVALHPNYKRSA